MILVIIGVLNAAISGYYYLRIAGAMFLRHGLNRSDRDGTGQP